MQQITTILRSLVSLEPTLKTDFFDTCVEKIIEYHDAPVHSLQEMRQKRSTKVKGDLFEAWCILFLRIRGYQSWLLKDVPEEILSSLGMKRFDVGIDIIALKYGRYSAIQCKFKKPRPGFVKGTWLPYNCVNWKEVSTFYSLCHRTQEKANWKYHIVMTNCKYVRRMGDPTPYDKTYAYGTFASLTRLELVEMIPKKRMIIIESEEKEETEETEESTEKQKEIPLEQTPEQKNTTVKKLDKTEKTEKTEQERIREARLLFYTTFSK
jgi:hypothetical protein